MDPQEIVNPKAVKKKPKNFHGHSFPQYDAILKCVKSEDKLNEFKNKVNRMIALIPKEDAKYSVEVVKFVMECAEMYFSKKKSGELKLRCCIEVLLPLFNHDKLLVDKFIHLVLPNIKRSNMLRRMYMRGRNLFFYLYETYLSPQ